MCVGKDFFCVATHPSERCICHIYIYVEKRSLSLSIACKIRQAVSLFYLLLKAYVSILIVPPLWPGKQECMFQVVGEEQGGSSETCEDDRDVLPVFVVVVGWLGGCCFGGLWWGFGCVLGLVWWWGVVAGGCAGHCAGQSA